MRCVRAADGRALGARSAWAGELGDDEFYDQFADLLDSTMLQSAPGAARVIAILEERGWKGWTRIERVPARSRGIDDRMSRRGPTSVCVV